MRHLDTRLLWIQVCVREGRYEVAKVAGVANPADMITKYLNAEAIFDGFCRMGCEAREGRAKTAPKCVGHVQCRPSQPMTEGSGLRRGVKVRPGFAPQLTMYSHS